MNAPRFDLKVALTNDVRHTPFVMAGLEELEERGLVGFSCTARGARFRDRVIVEGTKVHRVGRPYPCLNIDFVDHEAETKGRFALDLHDWREMFSLESIKTCQVVFKRMFVSDCVATVRRHFDVDIVPAGMTHTGPLSAWSKGWTFARARFWSRTESALNSPRRLLHGLKTRLARRKHSAPEQHAETSIDGLADRYVFFQVMYHPWGTGTEADALNQSRADLIRALRARLGSRFVGGMIFSSDPPVEYADCVSSMPSRRDLYLRLVQQSTVAVSTRGFGESPPWKLCEYLKEGKCILSERMPSVLASPLVDGEHLAFFDDPEECAGKAERLLDDDDLRRRLSEGAKAYYRQFVSPEAAVWRYLTVASAYSERGQSSSQ